MLYRISQSGDDGAMAIDVIEIADIVPAIAAQRQGKFHVDVMVGAHETLPSGYTPQKYGDGLRRPDGSVEFKVRPEPTPMAD
jgi:hypothetical protein